jgi:hypothetical protein
MASEKIYIRKNVKWKMVIFKDVSRFFAQVICSLIEYFFLS